MRISVLLLAGLSFAACSTPQQRQDAAIKDAAAALDAAAEAVEADTPPDQLAAIRKDAERSAEAKLEAGAAACGTKVHFTSEPRFEDRTVYIDQAATAEQLACLQKSFPFVQPSPH